MTDKPIIQADFVKPLHVPSRKVLQLVFEVPEEAGDHAMAILGGIPLSGKNRWCAIARLVGKPESADETITEAPTETERPKKEHRNWDDLSPTQQAGIRCNEAAFQKWLQDEYPDVWRGCVDMGGAADVAAGCVRWLCGRVTSRRDFAHNPVAAKFWQSLQSEFSASQRGQTEESLMEQRR